MIEFSGQINSVLRSYQKNQSPAVRANESRKTSGSEKSEASATPQKAAVSGGASVDEYTTVINFEYVPSGKVQLNTEARRQIIDLFQ